MKLSARNVLKGKIVDVTKGQTTAHVRLDIGGAIVTGLDHQPGRRRVETRTRRQRLRGDQGLGRHDRHRLSGVGSSAS